MTAMQIDRAVVEQALEVINDTAYGAPVFRQEVRDTITTLRAALAQQKDPTDPGNDVDVLREHVRHLERRVRELHAQQAEPAQEPAAYTTGHCENHKQKGGCQLHNLQCGWPDCDRKPTTAPPQQAAPQQAQRCRAEPRSDGDFVCDCRAGACPGRSAEPAQEPVAWMVYTEGGTSAYVTDNPTDLVGAYRALSLYTAPPQRTMVPLTEKEIERIGMKHVTLREVIRAVERAHGIKE